LPIEIYGFTGNSAYEQRKYEKIAAYRNSGDPYWHWDVATMGAEKGAWPTFPPQRWQDTEQRTDHPYLLPHVKIYSKGVSLPHLKIYS